MTEHRPATPFTMFADLEVGERFHFVIIGETFRVIDDENAERGVCIVVAVEDCRCGGDHHYEDDNGNVSCCRRPYATVERVTDTTDDNAA